MSKSGIVNKVTAERYMTIKRYIEERDLSCSDDVMVGKVFGVGRSTIRMIRNTRDYEEYQAKNKSYHKPKQASHRRQAIMPTSGLPLEELPIRKQQFDSSVIMLGGVGAAVLVVLLILAVIVVWLVFKEFYGI